MAALLSRRSGASITSACEISGLDLDKLMDVERRWIDICDSVNSLDILTNQSEEEYQSAIRQVVVAALCSPHEAAVPFCSYFAFTTRRCSFSLNRFLIAFGVILFLSEFRNPFWTGAALISPIWS